MTLLIIIVFLAGVVAGLLVKKHLQNILNWIVVEKRKGLDLLEEEKEKIEDLFKK